MIKKQISALFFLILLACAFPKSASASVVVNDASITSSVYGPGHVFLILSQSIPDGQGAFIIDIETVTSSQYLFSYAGIAEYYKLFTMNPGTRLDAEFVLQNAPIVSNDNNPGSSSQTFSTLNQSKYFGYWDDRLNGGTPDSNDNYGWVQLTRTASGLVATSSATAIGGGIIVGTTTQVPEPTPTMLVAFGTLLVFVRRTIRK